MANRFAWPVPSPALPPHVLLLGVADLDAQAALGALGEEEAALLAVDEPDTLIDVLQADMLGLLRGLVAEAFVEAFDFLLGHAHAVVADLDHEALTLL